jgi:ketosteroid isomerase-like protein
MTLEDAGIDALYTAWSDAILGLLTPDYMLLKPNGPPIEADALRPLMVAAFDKYDVSVAFEREDRVVSGDLAFEWGWDVQTARPRDGSEVRSGRQRVAVLLRRGADGVWRFARGVAQ